MFSVVAGSTGRASCCCRCVGDAGDAAGDALMHKLAVEAVKGSDTKDDSHEKRHTKLSITSIPHRFVTFAVPRPKTRISIEWLRGQISTAVEDNTKGSVLTGAGLSLSSIRALFKRLPFQTADSAWTFQLFLYLLLLRRFVGGCEWDLMIILRSSTAIAIQHGGGSESFERQRQHA
ncbi:hypothetical protein Q8A73_004124 [Channa argus]|nr:hypothetical protein Q8A73_004124 [Channa argus]